MHPANEYLQRQTRRYFLKQCQLGLGAAALASIGGAETHEKAPHFAPKAKSVIYLHLAGGPSQLELFDYKPQLQKYDGESCPDHLLEGKRFAFIQGVPTMLGTPFAFKRAGQNGTWMSELQPKLRMHADDLTIIRSMVTDQFNHAPAQLMLHTGNMRLGYASMGAWATYGLGSENENLPGYIVLTSGGREPDAGKSVWGSGFLPSVYQGVQCRTQGDPVLYVSNPAGIDDEMRRLSLDAIRDLNRLQHERFGDPSTEARIAQYELAYRMQTSVPEVMDIMRESEDTHERYGTRPGKVWFPNNCLLARRLVENGVRFVQLFDWGWDHHGTNARTDIRYDLPKKQLAADQAIAALLTDLKDRGLLDETLVVWGGEFGRTPMRENRGGKYTASVGRDHHPFGFTMWMAGGGVKAGYDHGATDEIGYYAAEDKVEVHDLQATILHLLGLDPFKFSYPYQGLDQRLIGPTADPRVVEDVIA